MPRTRCFFLAGLIISLLLPVAAQAAQPGTLYVQQARGGSLKHDDGHWTLTLGGPAPRVTTFSDRPARVGGAQSLRSFVGGWDAAFGKVGPNAALEISGAPASADVILVELGPPVFKDGAVRYRVKPITRSSATRLADFARRADRVGRGGRTFGRSTLFIDDGSTTTSYMLWWGGGADFGQLSVRFDVATLGFNSQIGLMSDSILLLNTYGIQVQPSGGAMLSGSISGALNLPAGGGPITGVATVPPDATVQLQIGGIQQAELTSGPFSVPAP